MNLSLIFNKYKQPLFFSAISLFCTTASTSSTHLLWKSMSKKLECLEELVENMKRYTHGSLRAVKLLNETTVMHEYCQSKHIPECHCLCMVT